MLDIFLESALKKANSLYAVKMTCIKRGTWIYKK